MMPEAEETAPRSVCSPLSKSSGSLIRIDSISIDLTSAMENHQEANNCDHFSLRGCVTEVRQKDTNVYLPRSADKTSNGSEEQKSILSPLDVGDSCLRKIGAARCAREMTTVKSKASLGPEKHADYSDAMEFYGPSFQSQISSTIRHVEENRSSSANVRQTGTLNSVPIQQRMKTMHCDIPNICNKTVGDIEDTKEITADDFSSGSGNTYSQSNHRIKINDGSSNYVPQQATKVRLLTELLGSGRNAENGQSRTTESGSDSAYDFCHGMTAQTTLKEQFAGKRKIAQDENGKNILLSKNPKLAKVDADFAIRKCTVVETDGGETSGEFGRQNNLNDQVLSENKFKEIQHDTMYPFSMSCPDAATKYHFAPSEGISTPAHFMYTEMDLQYKNLSQVQEGQGSNASEMKNKQVRKDFNAQKGDDLSLKSSGVAHLNEKSHIAKSIIGTKPLSFSWNGTLKEHLDPRNSSFNNKPAPDLGSGKDILWDPKEKIATQSPVCDLRNVIPQFGKGIIQHHRELFELSRELLDCKDVPPVIMLKSNLGNRNGEPRNDNQEKEHKDIAVDIVELVAKKETQRNYSFSEHSTEKRIFDPMGLPRVHENYHSEDEDARKVRSQSNEQLAPLKVNTISSSPDISETTEARKSAFARCSSLYDSQGSQPGGVLNSGFIEQCKSDHGSSFSSPKLGHSVVSNYTIFPQMNAPQASNFGTSSPFLEASNRGDICTDLDLGITSDLDNNLKKQKRDFGVGAPFGIQSNEAMPAMQLPGFMNFGMKSNHAFSSVGNRNMIPETSPARGYLPKVLCKPSFGGFAHVSSNGSRPFSSSYGKNQLRNDNTSERSPFGSFPSSFPYSGNFMKAGNGVPTQISGPKLQKRTDYSHKFDHKGIQCKSGSSPGEHTPGKFCFESKNPADFSIPEPGNIYMINYSDLKFGKNNPRKKRLGFSGDKV